VRGKFRENGQGSARVGGAHWVRLLCESGEKAVPGLHRPGLSQNGSDLKGKGRGGEDDSVYDQRHHWGKQDSPRRQSGGRGLKKKNEGGGADLHYQIDKGRKKRKRN